MLHAWKGSKLFDGKTEGNIPRGRPRRRREDNIEIDLTEIRWSVVYRIYLLRLATSVEVSGEHGNEPSGFKKCSRILELAERLVASREGLHRVSYEK
jgi:hypothetical protein